MKSNSKTARTIMVVAGEASGDLHGAGLVRALKETCPDIHFSGMGAQEMQQAGVELVIDSQNLGVMGVTEVFSRIKDIWKAMVALKQKIRLEHPDLLILIDYGDFNLRLAKFAKKLDIPVFYYIPPKVWVWRKGRVQKIARYVRCAGVILPFEESYLAQRGVNARYVGNPTLDSVRPQFDKSVFCRKYGIDENKAIIGILPGSRAKEVSLLLPDFLEAARRMQKKYSRELVFVIPLASSLTHQHLYNAGLAEFMNELEIHVIFQDRYEMMASCDAVVAASGTVTLELALLDIPMVVAYRFAPLTYMIGQLLIHIPFFSLVNIIANKEIVTEFLQDQVSPAAIELELARLVFDEDLRFTMKQDLQKVRDLLGQPGASERAAQLAVQTMETARSER